MSLPLDPKPFYVIEADEQDLGPESDAGRYSYADGVAEDTYGRETTVAALARFAPRKGYEQERLRYREAYKRPGMTLAEEPRHHRAGQRSWRTEDGLLRERSGPAILERSAEPQRDERLRIRRLRRAQQRLGRGLTVGKVKLALPVRGTAERALAEKIWAYICPPNPHGPQADLYFEMPYVRDSAAEATLIARGLLEDGWKPPITGVSVESLTKIDRPDVIVVGEGIVALVDANGTTIDMTTLQAIQLRLISEIPGHSSRIDPMLGEEVWLGCSCGKFHRSIGGSQGDLETVWWLWAEHLETILNAPKLADLPDGTYYDGTYEWEKDGKDWTPLRAHQGMPPTPEISRLKRVRKSYEDLDA